jgi:hypothetical protein
MQERLYVLTEDPRGWRVLLNDESLGLFATREQAFAAAVDAARASRALGQYAWVKVRHQEAAPLT